MRKTQLFIFTLMLICHIPLVAQNINISGKVTDIANSEPLIGVSIVIKGSTIGTITDIEGRYNLSAPTNSTLIFSYIGFTTQEVSVKNRKDLNVKLANNAQRLDEIVVVGASMKKTDLTGAVASVSSKVLQEKPVTSINQALQGRVAGVLINSGSKLGDDSSIKIRGINTINGSTDPIYVVDGLVMDNFGGGFNSINLNDVSSINVLKDASSTALYGSRGTNGVVLITTKKGKNGEGKVSYDGWIGTRSYAKMPETMNSKQLFELRRDAAINSYKANYPNASDTDLNSFIQNRVMTAYNPTNALSGGFVFGQYELDAYNNPNFQDNDWLSEVTRSGIEHNHSLGFTGGSDKGSYYLSFGYSDQEGMLKKLSDTEYTGRINSDYLIKSWLKVGTNTSFVRSNSEVFSDDGVFERARGANPMLKISEDILTLNYGDVYDQNYFNPLNSLKIDNNRTRNRLISSNFLNINPIKGLDVRTSFLINYFEESRFKYVPNDISFLLLLISVSTFGQNPEIIGIETKDMSMIFLAKPNDKIYFQYWGSKMVESFSFVNRGYKGQPDTQQDAAPQLFPAYGGRQYLNPALRVTHEDGVLTTELVYVNSQKKQLDENRIETVIHLKDKLYPLFVDVHFIAYQAEDVISEYVTVSHKEKKPIIISNIASSYIPLHADSYYLTHFYGTWAHEMQMKEEKLTPGIKTIESKKGVRATQSENPSFLLALNNPADENSGDVYGGSLAWSGNYNLSFEFDESGVLNIMSGMNPFAAEYRLKPGQPFQTPEMILTYSSTGKGQISRNFHDWSRKYALAHGDKLNPILLNSWEGAYFSFNEKTLTDMIDNAANFGIEMFVLDDGWFGNAYPRNGDNAGLGDWQVNQKKLPRGINYLADYAVSKSIRFGIWIEPEMVNPESELAKKHPEWVVKSGKREILPMRNQWLLDLTNPKVQDFVVKTFDDVVAQSPNITYVKWDANRHVDNVGSEYLPATEQTKFWYEYVKGLYSVYERIRAKHPHIEIQLCSSGGGRLDFGALKYHDEFWTSDNTNALDRVFIQYGSNTFFPAQATAAHVSTSPNHQTGMITPLKFRFDVAMTGRLGMELQPSDLKGDEYDFAKKGIECYKQIRPIVQMGDLYRLNSPYDENGWASLMYVSKDKAQAVFFAYSLKYHGRTTYFETKMNGLDSNKNYKVTEINNKNGQSSFYGNGKVYSGDYLMKVGVSLNIGNPFESSVLLISEQ